MFFQMDTIMDVPQHTASLNYSLSSGNAIPSFTKTHVTLKLVGSTRNAVEFLLFFLHVHNVVNM